MKVVSMELAARDRTGSRAARKLRADGRIPCIVHGLSGGAQVNVSVPAGIFATELGRGHRMFDVVVNGEPHVVLVRDLQWNSIGDRIEHVDFSRIDRNKPVRVYVPLEFVGRPKEAAGSILEHLMEDIEVECLPAAIPEKIEVLLGELELGQTITMGQIPLPAGSALADPGQAGRTVVTYHIRHEKVETPVEAGAEASLEPEVIEKGKKEEEGEEGAPTPEKKK